MLTRPLLLRLTHPLALLLIVVLLAVALSPASVAPSTAAALARPDRPQAPALASPSPIAQESGIGPSAVITPTVSAGGSHTCGLKSDGAAVCWGYDANGQVSGAPNATFAQISAGESHSCGVKSDGVVACWGRNIEAQVAPIPSGTFTYVSAGASHSCGVKTDGTLACWGDNTSGQAPSPAPAGTFTQVGAGAMHSCGLKTDNTIICWGSDLAGQATNPTPAGTFKEVSAGFLHTCGIKTDGTLLCWGELGQMSPTPSGTFRQISAGATHSCGIKTDGTLLCWGSNAAGQVGPAPAGSFTQVSAGSMHSCGVQGQSLLCWGKNDQGQAENRVAPTIISEPVDKTLNAKATLSLSVLVSGSPTPSFQWRRNGQAIPGASNATFTSQPAKISDTGTYDVVITNIMGTATSESVDVVVKSLDQVLGFATLEDKRYGDPVVTLWASASSKLPVHFSILAGSVSITDHYLTINGAGRVTLRAEQPGDDFYRAAVPLTKTFMVERAPLTIIANDQIRLLDEPNPTLTASYIGLVNNDTPEDLDRKPIITSLGSLGAPPGEYPIVIAGASDANYEITLVNGTMRVVRQKVFLPVVLR